MAKKITIQHWYTTTGTTAPTGLIDGEIAISHATGSEAIFLKNDKNNKEVKFIPKTQIDELISDATTGLSTQLSKHITVSGDTDILGHVYLVSGDVENIKEYKVGEAASSYHTHGQYLEESLLNRDKGFQMTPALGNTPKSYGVKAGSGITVDSNGVSINDEYQGKIASGATAYGWGNHASMGYLKDKDLTTLKNSVTTHIGNTKIHVEQEQKDAWDAAKDAINAFLNNNAAISGAVDTLREINEYLTGTGTSVETLLETLNDLTIKVTGNTSDITSLKSQFGDNGSVTLIEKEVLKKIEEIKTEGNLSAAHGVTDNGGKKYTITHTPASTQASAITATNNPTGLSFGSEFKIVNNIGYDANGHVVSGSTQTLKLPTVPTATTADYGIVKIQHGDLGIVKELINSPSGTAADVNHFHSQYVKFTDLYSGNTSNDSIIISCGTY